jgi:tRNA(fMet)-specific endonuclease VapC
MSLYVLDTDILSLYADKQPVLAGRLDTCPPPGDEVVITVMSVEEVLSGWYAIVRQAKRPPELAHAYQRLADSARFLGRWRVLSFTESAIARYDYLKGLKLNIGKMDLRIAAITLEEGGTLVTRNARDFQRVPGLTIEDWTL